MELDTFVLLGGFAVTKVGLGVAIVWAGMRSGERPEEDDGEAGRGPASPPGHGPTPAARRARRRAERDLAPARGPGRGRRPRERVR